MLKNLFEDIPDALNDERFDALFKNEKIRVERILSHGQSSPEKGWYDQSEDEWVLVLKGAGTLFFQDGRKITLTPGEHIHIPAGVRHRVSWTDPLEVTLWLAVFAKP